MARPRVRDKIVLAARELLQQQGAAALTTRAVAEQAGVTEASVFNNFGDKAGLIGALINEQLPEFDLFQEALSQSADSDLQSWLSKVLHTANNYFRIILPLAAPHLLQTNKPPQQSNYSGHRPLSERLQELQLQGLIAKEVDIESAALLIMGAAMHSALTAITQGDNALGKNNEDWSRRLAKTFLQQISVPAT